MRYLVTITAERLTGLDENESGPRRKEVVVNVGSVSDLLTLLDSAADWVKDQAVPPKE